VAIAVNFVNKSLVLTYILNIFSSFYAFLCLFSIQSVSSLKEKGYKK